MTAAFTSRTVGSTALRRTKAYYGARLWFSCDSRRTFPAAARSSRSASAAAAARRDCGNIDFTRTNAEALRDGESPAGLVSIDFERGIFSSVNSPSTSAIASEALRGAGLVHDIERLFESDSELCESLW